MEVPMNAEKPKKDLVKAWLSGEEIPVPTRSRSRHLLAAYVKISRPLAGRPPQRVVPPSPAEPGLDPLSMCDPGPIPVLNEHHLQRASWDHLQKLKHLGRMRASFEYIPIKRPPTGRPALPAEAGRPGERKSPFRRVSANLGRRRRSS
jgi:hypothetical protein